MLLVYSHSQTIFALHFQFIGEKKMDRNRGKDRDEIIEDFADDLLSKDTNSSRHRISSHSKSHGKTIILWAAGILIFIVLISLLLLDLAQERELYGEMNMKHLIHLRDGIRRHSLTI